MELNKTIITDMGILSNEVYNDQGQKYFEFNEDGTRVKNTIATVNGTYTIIDSTDIPSDIDANSMHSITGMEALLLRAPDGSFVIAFRGTETKFDDILTDFTIFLTSLVTGTGIAWNAQRSDAELFVSDMIRKHSQDGLTASNLTLTGHSLGGILAQTIASTQNLEAYTFNALGTTGLTRFENPNGTKILNLSYSDDGLLNGDPLSNAATFWGNQHVGEVLPMIGEDLGLGAHGMGYMNAVIATYNFILENFISAITYRDVTHAYLENGRLDSFFSNTYEKTNQYLFTDVNIGTGSSLSFNFFNYLTASQIEQQAKDDRAVLFALIKLNGFAIEGTLDSYNKLNLADYSSMYIQERSLMLFDMLDPDDTRPVRDNYFEDIGYDGHFGSKGIFSKNPEIIFGSDQTDIMTGSSKADYLFGMDGNDILIGDDGDDYLEGGKGTDIFFGGTGDDTYMFNRGDGSDTINDIAGENDTLQFGKGITKSDIVAKALENGDLVIAIKETAKKFDVLTDKIILKNWFNTGSQIEFLRFDDGTVLDEVEIAALQIRDGEDNYLHYVEGTNTFDGGAGNDTIVGSTGDDTIEGGDGGDTIYGGAGNDTLSGGESVDHISGFGTDILYGGDGDDILMGNGGSDYLEGGDGKDILYGGEGDDYLVGRNWNHNPNLPYTDDGASDILDGGAGWDVYFPGNNDIIEDADGLGIVFIDQFPVPVPMNGGFSVNGGGIYYGSLGTFSFNNGALVYTGIDSFTFSILNFRNGDLGISFFNYDWQPSDDQFDPTPYLPNGSTPPIDCTT